MRLVTSGRASNSAESEAKGNLRIDFESLDPADGTPRSATIPFQPVWENHAVRTGIFAGFAAPDGHSRQAAHRLAAISDEEAAVLLAQLETQMEALRRSSSQTPLSTSHDLLAMRTIDLPFYADRVLTEALLASKDQEQKTILSFVLPKVGDTADDNGHGDALVVLDGTNRPIHVLNTSVPVSLGGAAQALAYLRFFCGFVWGPGGGFWTVERIQELPWSGDADQGLKAAAAADLRPLEIESETQDAFRAKGSVLYDRHIFHADFEIEKKGMTQMLDDDSISKKGLPVLADRREGPFRLID